MGLAIFAYSGNYLLDVKFGVIVDVEPPASSAKPRSVQRDPGSSEQRFGLEPARLEADPV